MTSKSFSHALRKQQEMCHIAGFRSGKDAYFGTDHGPPITNGQRERFNGLAYFVEAPNLLSG
jgi:hypothetical protein|tara:strand:+ start:252 stop:437 length:186 start_codon:yes stop_codon:yes gene_type:complete